MARDDLSASEAPLFEHLVELRSRLLWSLGFFTLAFVGCIGFAERIYRFLLCPF